MIASAIYRTKPENARLPILEYIRCGLWEPFFSSQWLITSSAKGCLTAELDPYDVVFLVTSTQVDTEQLQGKVMKK